VNYDVDIGDVAVVEKANGSSVVYNAEDATSFAKVSIKKHNIKLIKKTSG